MNYLQVENISKSYGIKPLFNNVTIGINKGQKIALIAKNGSGKSTLLKILAGLEVPDSGLVSGKKDIRISFLEQDPKLDLNKTLIDAILEADSPVFNAVRQYEQALENLHDQDNAANQKALEYATIQMEANNAWDVDAKLKSLLGKFNITRLADKVSTLSGGQRKRLAMCRIIIDEPDLLLLDEPTNHLDVEMIEWLEGYLATSNLTLLMVTHDRYFLDAVCNEIAELDGSDVYRYKGNYAYYLEKKAEREESTQRTIEKAKNLYTRELDWMRRQPKARGTKSKSRIDSFYDVEKVARQRLDDSEVQLSVKMNRIGGKILELKKVYKSYGNLVLLKGFDYTFKAGDRIGIVGRNGTGKSTFLNIITQTELPDSGKVNIGETIVMGYYSQHGMQFKDDRRMIEVIKEIADVIPMADGSKLTAAQLLNRFLFPNETHYTLVGNLSGGERRRLYLLTILMKNPNFLILDEPTNDLDILTLNVLEDFLLDFPGVLIVVSHDRYFMDRLSNHLFVFEGDGVVRDYNGNYTDYRLELAESQRNRKQQTLGTVIEAEPETTAEPKAPKKLSFKDKFEFEQLEKEIPALEQQKAELETKLTTIANHDELLKTSALLGTVITSLETKTERWLVLSELMEG